MSETFAEDCSYWKTSRSAPESWLDKAVGLIERMDGLVLSYGYGTEGPTGRAAYMIHFKIDGDTFKIIWPALITKTGDTQAAKRQAATMLHHDVKAKCIAAQVLGARAAFFCWLQLEGKPILALANQRILDEVPRAMLPGSGEECGQ